MRLHHVFLTLAFAVTVGCGGGGGGTPDGLTDEEFRIQFADRAVALWLGMDFTYGGNGSFGIDGAGTVFATLQDLDYLVPDSTADGIRNNLDTATPTPNPFNYVGGDVASSAELVAGDFSNLVKGDLIFLDYDFDDEFDHVAIYLGAYGSFTHAAFTASDYYDECVIADMGDYNDPFTQDIEWSNSVAVRLDHAGIASVYTP